MYTGVMTPVKYTNSSDIVNTLTGKESLYFLKLSLFFVIGPRF